MANKQECAICKKAIKEKYKHFLGWKITAIVFICLTMLFGCLYFGSGDLFKKTINNDVDIVNEGDNNDNDVNIRN